MPGYEEILDLLRTRLRDFRLRRSILKNLAAVTYAFLILSKGGRSGNGKLSLSAIARTFYANGTQKSRFKRLSRFLNNRLFTAEVIVPYLIYFVTGDLRDRFIPVVVDQTAIGSVQVIMAGVLFSGRVLPVAFMCFLYEKIYKSQNRLETGFLTLVRGSFPDRQKPVFIMDRAYGRLQLIQALNRMNGLYVARAKSNVIVWIGNKAKSLNRFSCKQGKAVRYSNVIYRKDRKEPVDIVIYFEPRFKEVWYLIVPARSEAILPTKDVVKLYRARMQIEQGFRDWKTHLGVRGLKLKVDRDTRLTRLLFALSVAYLLLVLLGASSLGESLRTTFEIKRTKPRHGTTRSLSVLTLGTAMLAAADRFPEVIRQLLRIIRRLKTYSALSLILRI
jgi:Transposase DDE domain